MGKIFDFDARKGSYIDYARDTTATALAVPFTKRGKGLAAIFNASTSYIKYNGHDDLTGDVTVEAWINVHGVGEGGAGRIIDNMGLIVSVTSATDKQFFVTSDSGGTWKYSANNAWITNEWLHLIVTRTAAGLTNIYVNNVITGTADETSGTPVVGLTDLVVGNSDAEGSTFDGMMYKVSISNHIYSSAERSSAYNRYLYSYPRGIEKHPQYVRKDLDLSRESENGLLIAYNMVANGNSLVDISGNLNDATVYGGVSGTKEGLSFNGKNSYVQSSGALTGDYKTLVFRFKPREAITASSTGQTLFARPDTNVQHILLGDNGTATATILFYGLINKQTYIKDEFPADQWIDLVLRWNGTSYDIWANGTRRTTYYVTAHMTLMSSTSIDIGLMTDTGYGPFNGEISDFRIYNNAFTDAEIETLHNSFVKCTFHEDFSEEGADGVSKVPSGWMKSEGDFTIGELTTQDSVLKHLRKGNKYLQGVTLGYILIPSIQAYGTWEFDLYRVNATIIGVAFIADKCGSNIKNGYAFSLLPGVAVLSKYIAGTPSDIAIGGSGLNANTWYKIKITRTRVGVFNVYVKGGAYGNADYTTLFADVTENTIKTSEYAKIVANTNDKITNLDFYDDIKINLT